MKRLRVALVANNIHARGGMERYCAELVNHLCDRHEFHLFATRVEDVPFNKVTVHLIPCRTRPIFAFFTQFYIKSSLAVRAGDFDIVHSIGGITRNQNFVTAQYCMYAWGDAIRHEPGASEGTNAYHRLMCRYAGYFEQRAVSSPQTLRISACSERTKSDLVRFCGADEGKIVVLHNAVDSNRFHPDNQRYRQEVRARYGLPQDALVILFVGEYQRKGLSTVIRALGLIGQPDAYILAVGTGDLARYEEIARLAGVSARVVLAGPTGNIEQVFGAADIFAFPTFYEPFGMVVTEAMASELPVVTSRSAGAAEMIDENQSGFLVDRPGDPAEFAERLKPLLASQSLRIDVGRAARQAVAGHDWSRVAEETSRLYLECVNAPKIGESTPSKEVSVRR